MWNAFQSFVYEGLKVLGPLPLPVERKCDALFRIDFQISEILKCLCLSTGRMWIASQVSISKRLNVPGPFNWGCATVNVMNNQFADFRHVPGVFAWGVTDLRMDLFAIVLNLLSFSSSHCFIDPTKNSGKLFVSPPTGHFKAQVLKSNYRTLSGMLEKSCLSGQFYVRNS